jgi:hypothetical protein
MTVAFAVHQVASLGEREEIHRIREAVAHMSHNAYPEAASPTTSDLQPARSAPALEGSSPPPRPPVVPALSRRSPVRPSLGEMLELSLPGVLPTPLYPEFWDMMPAEGIPGLMVRRSELVTRPSVGRLSCHLPRALDV